MAEEGISDTKKYRILSLDGGGCRGIFTYHLLDNVYSILPKSDLLVSQFDLIVGVSVGAILGAAIATGLFESKLQRATLIEDGLKVFGTKNESQPLFAPVYTGTEKRNSLKRHFGKLKMKNCKCPLIVIAADITAHLVLFKSWEDSELLLVDVLDATSAAPTYFPPVKIKDTWFWDGGLVCNCPIDIAVQWAHKLFKKSSKLGEFNFCILSIGNKVKNPQSTQIKDPQKIGLISCIKLGLVDALLGLNNTTTIENVKLMYGEDSVLRITGNLDPFFDDVSHAFQQVLILEASKVWEESESAMMIFFADLKK
jgi:predicted acylesterase/phospholipase RssA